MLLTASQSASGRTVPASHDKLYRVSASRTLQKTTPDSLCKPGCVTVIDYQSESTHLGFSRTYNPANMTRHALAGRWRHRYEIRLTGQGDDRIVFDHHGVRHPFRLNSDGTYSPVNISSGNLLKQDGQYRWTDKQKIQHRFYGSYPMSLHFPDDQVITLEYRFGQLHSITDDEHSKIELVRSNGSISGVLIPEGKSLRHSSNLCRPDSPPSVEDDGTVDPSPGNSETSGPGDGTSPTEEPPERCDTEKNPSPGFDAIQSRPGVSSLDARPASCQSYFVEFYGTVRGEQIEAGLEQHPPYVAMVPTTRSFPIIDFIDGNELIVVRSRDLGSPTYNDPDADDALYDRLMRDGAQIQSRALDPLETEGFLTGTENGRTTLITFSERQHVTLHMLVRQNMASAGHWQQIENARTALEARYGIRLQVVIIP